MVVLPTCVCPSSVGPANAPKQHTVAVYRAFRISLACTVEIHAGLQLLPITPAHAQAGSVVEQHVVFPILVQLETANAIQPNDGRTVNPAEDRLIQLLVEFRHATPQKVRLRTNMQAGVVIRCLDPVDLGYFEELKLAA